MTPQKLKRIFQIFGKIAIIDLLIEKKTVAEVNCEIFFFTFYYCVVFGSFVPTYNFSLLL